MSEDAGLTWQPLIAAADSDFLGYILVAPNQPEQLYLRALTLSSGTASFSYATWHSSDAGKTWEHSSVTLAESETDLDLLAVSPSDPQLLVAKAEAQNAMFDPERLLVSHDAGKTFDSPITLHVINAVAFSDDGATLSVGSDDGLFVSSDAGKTFAKVGAAAFIESLSFDHGELMVGGYFHGVEAGTHGVGISGDGGATMTQWMLLNQVVHPLACDPTAMSAIDCKQLWPDWEREILGISDDPSAAGAGGTAAGSGTMGNSPADTGAVRTAGMPPSADAATAAVSGGGAGDSAQPTVAAAPASAHASGCSVHTLIPAPPGSNFVGLAGLACAWLLNRRRSPFRRHRRTQSRDEQ